MGIMFARLGMTVEAIQGKETEHFRGILTENYVVGAIWLLQDKTVKYKLDGESKNHSCPLSYSFCIFFGSLSGNMAFIASSLPSFIAVS